MRMLLLIFVLPSLVVVSGAQGGGGLSDAVELIERGEYDRALEALTEVKKRRPEAPQAYFHSARALLRAGRARDAEVEVEEALSRAEGAEASLALSMCRFLDELGYPQLASAFLEQRRALGSTTAEENFLLAQLYFKEQRLDRVLEALQDYEPVEPLAMQKKRLLLGNTLMRMGQLEEALEQFEQVVQHDPDSHEGFFGLADTSLRGNNPEAAERMIQGALKLDPSNPEYLHLKGMILLRLERASEAVENLLQAADASSDPTRIYFDLGEAYRRAGDAGKAREFLSRYQELHRHREADRSRTERSMQLNNQARQLLQNGQIPQAVLTFQRVLEDNPENWTAHSFLAKIYLSSRRGRSAEPHLRKLLEIDPTASEGLYLNAFYFHMR
ncbi:MAG TPA: tetratricopeptide repeat protein, partial [Acidobacteriota bacterium]|nr:tetratricopeptide repeat protein [Acidobacteriota bacterium]